MYNRFTGRPGGDPTDRSPLTWGLCEGIKNHNGRRASSAWLTAGFGVSATE